MKIIVICYYYAPTVNPRSLRWTALCEDLAIRGHEVHVICKQESGFAKEESLNGVHCHRVGFSFRSTVIESENSAENGQVKSVFYGDSVAATQNIFRHSSRFKNVLKWIHGLTWKKVYWPDSLCLWILPAVRRARLLINAGKYDALISVSHPFSGHLAGLFVSLSAQRIYWLADSGDPFALSKESQPNNFQLYSKLNYWIEAKILSRVNHFSVTTTQTKKIYCESFAEWASKIRVIPPLLQDIFTNTDINKGDHHSETDLIRLLFVGSFYSHIRSPIPLLNLLSESIVRSQVLKERLQLHVIGPKNVISDSLKRYPDLKSRVFLHGSLSHEVSVKSMKEATCLVNIGNSTDYQLPSKVIEYMAMGKPVLNIPCIQNDLSSDALRHYPLHFTCHPDKSDNVPMLCDYLENVSRQSLSEQEAKEHVLPFTKDTISKQYLDLIYSLSEDQGVK